MALDATDLRRTLHYLAQTAGADGAEDLRALLGAASASLAADFAFVGELLPERHDQVRMLEFVANGTYLDPFDYDLDGTPCQDVVNQTFRFHGDGVARRFRNPMLARLRIESYAALPLFDSKGQAIGLMGVMSRAPLATADIAEAVLRILSARAAAALERRSVDAARQRSDASYRAILESTEDAVFVHDLDTGAILDVNQKACERYGYAREEMLELDVVALSAGVPPYTQADAVRYIAQAAAGTPVRFEWRARTRSGELRWDEVILKRTRLGDADRILAFTRDITERKDREEALRKSEDRLRASIAAALDSVIVMDAQGDIIEFNPAAEACFGYRRAEVLGRRLGDCIVPARYRQAHHAGLEHFLATGEGPYLGRRVEVTAQRRDGREFPAELTIGVAHGEEGRIFIGYMRDMTEPRRAAAERERLEAQLRQAQKMEAIGHLTGGIAHDFNNILTGVMGYVGMAQERVVSRPDDKLVRYLERAQHVVGRGRDLIQQMLTFSRGRRGAPQPLDLTALVPDAIQLIEATLPSSIEIATHLSPSLPAVMFDPVQLEQILMNLCINARDAMNHRGAISIAVRLCSPQTEVCCSCHAPCRGDHVELAVQDTGPGIEPAHLERLFEPFFTTKEIGKGSGMGLAVVHGIVHEHGGHILVTTAPGSGTLFRVLLPVAHGATAAAAALSILLDHPPRTPLVGRVLIVEEDGDVREFLTERLTAWGLEVSAHAQPGAALAACTTGSAPFDLAVVDQALPRVSGIELSRQLLQAQPGLAVVLYTGSDDETLAAQAQTAGLRCVLTKPVDTGVLLRAIEQCASTWRGAGVR